MEKITEKNGGIKMAVDVLKYMSRSDIERMWYEDEILAEIDREAEIDYKLKEERIETAMELLRNGIDITIIAKSTKQSINEIEKLKEMI